MQWLQGRQGTGYEKLKLFESPKLMADAWLLKAKAGVSIPAHVDPVPGYKHFRVNVILKQASLGGVFSGIKTLVDLPRLKVFRSDFVHSVSEIEAGTRLVLSVGICLKDKAHGR